MNIIHFYLLGNWIFSKQLVSFPFHLKKKKFTAKGSQRIRWSLEFRNVLAISLVNKYICWSPSIKFRSQSNAKPIQNETPIPQKRSLAESLKQRYLTSEISVRVLNGKTLTRKNKYKSFIQVTEKQIDSMACGIQISYFPRCSSSWSVIRQKYKEKRKKKNRKGKTIVYLLCILCTNYCGSFSFNNFKYLWFQCNAMQLDVECWTHFFLLWWISFIKNLHPKVITIHSKLKSYVVCPDLQNILIVHFNVDRIYFSIVIFFFFCFWCVL